MSRKLRKLRKLNNQLEKNLNQENQNILTDIVVYLRSSQISEYQQELIRRDITEMMSDGEQRGMSMQDVLGDNYQDFCDNILSEVPHQKTSEKILSMLGSICLYGWVVVVIWFVTSLFESIIGKNTLPFLILRLGNFLSYAILIFVSIFVVDYICKTSFDKEKNKLLAQSHQKLIFMVVVWIILYALSRIFLNNYVFMIHIYVAISLFAGLFVMYKLFDELWN